MTSPPYNRKELEEILTILYHSYGPNNETLAVSAATQAIEHLISEARIDELNRSFGEDWQLSYSQIKKRLDELRGDKT